MSHPTVHALTVVALLFSGASAKESPGDRSQAELLAEFPESRICKQEPTQNPTVAQLVCRAIAEAGDDMESVTTLLSQWLRLETRIPSLLIEVVLDEYDIRTSLGRPTLSQVRHIESNLLSALELSGGHPLLAWEAGAYYRRRAWDAPLPSQRLPETLSVLQGDRNVVLMMLTGMVGVIEPIGENQYGCLPSKLLYSAISLNPDDAGLLVLASNYADSIALRVALAERAFLLRDRPETKPLVRELAPYRWLVELANAGLLDEATGVLESLEPETQERVLSGGLDGLASGAPDLRLEVTAAYYLQGDSSAAKKILSAGLSPEYDSVPPELPDRSGTDDEPTWIREIRWHQLSALLDSAQPDPFELVQTVLVATSGHHIETGADDSFLWSRVLETLMERGGYTDGVAYLRKRMGWRIDRWPDGDARCGAERLLPQALRSEAESRQQEIDEAWEVRLTDFRIEDGPQGRDTLAAFVRQRLESPRLDPFERRRLSSSIGPAELPPAPGRGLGEPDLTEEEVDEFLEELLSGDGDQVAAIEPSAESPADLRSSLEEEFGIVRGFQSSGLADFRLVRRDEVGDVALEVGLSYALDPVGELPTSGYWLRLTDEAGDQLLTYLGLRRHLPYVVTETSGLPLLKTDRLRIEVRERRLLESSITFPPVGLRFDESDEPIYLEVGLEDLLLDSDADGLTDLVEERLLTNPHAVDTDGDGYIDASDPLPLVPYGSAVQPSWPALDVLKAIADVEAAVPGEAIRETLDAKPTLFWVGRREDFTDVWPNRRVVVLSLDELEAYQAKFGRTFAHGTELLLTDQSRTRVFVIWSQRWRGGMLRFDEGEDGEWKQRVLTGWVS